MSDFRVAHVAVLDRLLVGGVAALVAQSVVALDVLAQDGLRVRAAAGAGSFRRRQRLVELAAATARVEQLRGELDADPAAGDRRQRAWAFSPRACPVGQQRAAREGEEPVKAALDRMSELEAERTVCAGRIISLAVTTKLARPLTALSPVAPDAAIK